MSHIPTPDTTVSSGRYPKHAYQEQNGSPHFKVILLSHLEGVKNRPERRPTSTFPPDPQNPRCEREGCGPQDLLSRSSKAPPPPRRDPATSNQAAKQHATAISKLKYLTRPGVLTVASIFFSIIPIQSQYVPCYHFVASIFFSIIYDQKTCWMSGARGLKTKACMTCRATSRGLETSCTFQPFREACTRPLSEQKNFETADPPPNPKLLANLRLNIIDWSSKQCCGKGRPSKSD